jgi:alpha-L-rhamnosidase
MKWQAKWIKPQVEMDDICPLFAKNFSSASKVKNAKLLITALGVYEATLNGKRIGEYILAPGWTTYTKRLQYQEYNVTELILDYNQILITVGKGWYRGRLGWGGDNLHEKLRKNPAGLIVQLEIVDCAP